MSHDTDLIIRQDEKNKEDKRKKRKRRKKKKAAKEEEDEEDGTPQDKKAHKEDMDVDGEEAEEQKKDEKVHPERHDREIPSSESPAAECQRDPGKNESDACETRDPNQSPKACNRKVEGGTHRAGFDAFMTGYIFAFASIRNAEGSDSWIPACTNKLYLSGKSVPLQIVKSSFSKSSRAHVTKMEHIWRKQVPKADGSV